LPAFSGSAPVIRRASRGPCSTADTASTSSITTPSITLRTRVITLKTPRRSRNRRRARVSDRDTALHCATVRRHRPPKTRLRKAVFTASSPAGSPSLRHWGAVDTPVPFFDAAPMTDTPTALHANKPSLYVVDAFNFLFRAFHALPPLTTTTGIQTGAVYGLCQMLLKIERENRPTHLCAVFDAPGENFRNRLSPVYKADRPPMPPELAPQVGLVNRVIDAFGIQSLAVPGFEADDVIATVARLAVAAGMEVVICSSDKDLMQLCGG